MRHAYLTMMNLLLAGIVVSVFDARPEPALRGEPVEDMPGRRVKEIRAVESHRGVM